MIVNGREYKLWGQFVKRKKHFLGLRLEKLSSGYPEMGPAKTKITDITLKPNGEKSAFFEVIGQDFSCGFDVGVGGVTAGESGWITFTGYGGHTWRIQSSPEDEN